MAKFFLLLSESPDSNIPNVSWYLASNNKAAKKSEASTETEVDIGQGTGTLEEFSRIYHENFSDVDVAAILPSQYLTYIPVAVTVKNQRQMLQALPFLIEEQIIGNIEDMHIATTGKFSDEFILIAIIDKSLLKKINEIFYQVNIPIKAMYGLQDVFSPDSDELNVFLYNDVALVKTPQFCLQCEQDNLSVFFDALVGNNSLEARITYRKDDKSAERFAKKIKLEMSTANVEITTFSGEILPYLLSNETLPNPSPINILQGEFSTTDTSEFQRWVPLVWVVLLCFFMQIGFNITTGYYFGRKAIQMENNVKAYYLKLFPGETKIVNISAQLNGKLNQSSSTDDENGFARIFAATANAMNSVGNKNDIKLQQFRYDKSDKELKIGVDSLSIALLDKLKKDLGAAGYSVEIVSANDDGSLIKATVLIKPL